MEKQQEKNTEILEITQTKEKNKNLNLLKYLEDADFTNIKHIKITDHSFDAENITKLCEILEESREAKFLTIKNAIFSNPRDIDLFKNVFINIENLEIGNNKFATREEEKISLFKKVMKNFAEASLVSLALKSFILDQEGIELILDFLKKSPNTIVLELHFDNNKRSELLYDLLDKIKGFKLKVLKLTNIPILEEKINDVLQILPNIAAEKLDLSWDGIDEGIKKIKDSLEYQGTAEITAGSITLLPHPTILIGDVFYEGE